jgi:DNA-binding FadR family transcriptional regulator
MEFGKLSTPTLKELFIQELENRILSGKMEIGSKLPTERELADMMQVSRSVVNGGIVEMAKKGFLIIKPRIGTFVADYRRNGSLETLISIMSYNGGMLRKSEIKSILEVRILMDTLAVQLAIPKITTDELSLLKDRLAQLGKAKTTEQAAEQAFHFHHELSIISGNTLLPLIFNSSRLPITSLWERYCRIYGISTLYQNTSMLYKCIKEKDVEKAVDVINRTILNTISGENQIYTE